MKTKDQVEDAKTCSSPCEEQWKNTSVVLFAPCTTPAFAHQKNLHPPATLDNLQDESCGLLAYLGFPPKYSVEFHAATPLGEEVDQKHL